MSTSRKKQLLRNFRLNEAKAATPWIVCMVAALFFFYEFIQMNMLNSLSTGISQSFHLSAHDIGNFSSIFFYGDMALLFPAGIILDRSSTRKIILFSMGLCVISVFGFALAEHFWFATFCRFITGASNAFGFLSCLILASRWFPQRKLALVTALIVTLAMCGGIIAQNPLISLDHHYGWRHALLFNGYLGIAILLLICLVVHDSPGKLANQPSDMTDQENDTLPFWQNMMVAISNAQNWKCGLYTSIVNLPLMVLGGVFGTPYLHQVHHLTVAQSSNVSSMLFFGTIIGGPVFGAISDKIQSRRLPMIIGSVVSLLLVLSFMWLSHIGFYALLVIFLLLGFFTSSQILGYPVITESNPSNSTGVCLGLGSMIIMAGAGLSEQLFGFIMDSLWDGTIVQQLPVYTNSAYQKALYIFPISLLISLLIAFTIKETLNNNTNLSRVSAP